MQCGSAGKNEVLEIIMLVTVFVETVCTLGVAFYARFLFALCKECRHPRISYLVCMRTRPEQHAVSGDHGLNDPIRRAA
jgi:hypothetical protein